MVNRIRIDGKTTDLMVLLDNEILFEKVGIKGSWMYVHLVNGQITNEYLPRFDESYLNIFIDDIVEQLKNGIDRNNLTINIPKRVESVKCGNKIIQIEV